MGGEVVYRGGEFFPVQSHYGSPAGDFPRKFLRPVNQKKIR